MKLFCLRTAIRSLRATIKRSFDQNSYVKSIKGTYSTKSKMIIIFFKNEVRNISTRGKIF